MGRLDNIIEETEREGNFKIKKEDRGIYKKVFGNIIKKLDNKDKELRKAKAENNAHNNFLAEYFSKFKADALLTDKDITDMKYLMEKCKKFYVLSLELKKENMELKEKLEKVQSVLKPAKNNFSF